MLGALPKDRGELLTVSMDIPFARHRWPAEACVRHRRRLHDGTAPLPAGVLLLLVLLGVVRIATAGEGPPAAPSAPQEDFATFTRPDLGFSLRYPRSWEVWVQGPAAWEARSLGWRVSFVGPPGLPRRGERFRPVVFVEHFPRLGLTLAQYVAAHQEVARRDQRDQREHRQLVAAPVAWPGGERYLLEESYAFNGISMRKRVLFVREGDGVFHVTAVAPAVAWAEGRRHFEGSLASFALLPR